MELVNHIDISSIKENDLLLFEVDDFSVVSEIQRLLQDLQKKLPPGVSLVCMRKGDFLTLKTEEHMNKLGWFKLKNGDGEYFPEILNEVKFKKV